MSEQLTAPGPTPPAPAPIPPSGPWPSPHHRARPRPPVPSWWRRRWPADDAGMSTVEYAIGTIAAAAFAALLYAVVSGDTILTALTDLVQRALTATF